MNVLKIVQKYLRSNGFDGLYHDNDCGCQLDDLGPCSCFCLECTPGYKKTVPPGFPVLDDVDFIIGPK
jgi:hypothetical protein